MAISRSLIPQQISKGGKMPKVGKKHFKYTKAGYAKAKKHAEETGKEVKYAMDGGMMNRKYYASGGAVYGAARKRKPTGRLNIGDIKKAQYKVARTRKPTGRLSDKDITRAMQEEMHYSRAGRFPGKAAMFAMFGKPVPRKKKLYDTLQKQSQAQKRKKAKKRAIGVKHLGKPRSRSGIVGRMKYLKQLPEGKRKFGKGGVIKKVIKKAAAGAGALATAYVAAHAGRKAAKLKKSRGKK
jgi:hypothetical protein